MLSFLFSMRGRVNRLQYWLGSIGIYVGMWMALVAVVFITLGSAGLKPSNEAAVGAIVTLMTLGLPVIGVAVWMQMALQIKRLHDRGRSWAWSMLPFAVSLPFYMSAFSAGFSGGAASVNPMDGVLALAVMAVSLWMFVDLGCLPGQEGPNKYGDPPGNGGGSRAPVAPASPMQPQARTAAAAQQQMQAITGATAMRGADAAMERAIAEQAAARAQQAAFAAASANSSAPRQAAPGSFGRRVSR